MKYHLPLALAATTMIAACGAEPEPAEDAMTEAEPATEQRSAMAELLDAEGNAVGTATVTENDGMLSVDLVVNDIPAGIHGAHIHTTGDCTAEDFSSAGGHWNPDNTNHGTESQAPNPHAGDLPNITVAESGSGILESVSTGTFDGLMDADGAAFVIHEGEDDYESQPSGDAGARIACGVFTAS